MNVRHCILIFSVSLSVSFSSYSMEEDKIILEIKKSENNSAIASFWNTECPSFKEGNDENKYNRYNFLKIFTPKIKVFTETIINNQMDKNSSYFSAPSLEKDKQYYEGLENITITSLPQGNSIKCRVLLDILNHKDNTELQNKLSDIDFKDDKKTIFMKGTLSLNASASANILSEGYSKNHNLTMKFLINVTEHNWIFTQFMKFGTEKNNN